MVAFLGFLVPPVAGWLGISTTTATTVAVVGSAAATAVVVNQTGADRYVIDRITGASNARTAAGACAGCSPPGCDDRRRGIEDKKDNLRQHAKALARNRHNLPFDLPPGVPRGRGTILGHQQEIRDLQRNLKKDLDAYEAANCGRRTNEDVAMTNFEPPSPGESFDSLFQRIPGRMPW